MLIYWSIPFRFLIQKLDEATSLLSATCDTFIKTLDECMVLSNAAAASASALPEVSHPRITDSALPPSPTKPALKKVGTSVGWYACFAPFIISMAIAAMATSSASSVTVVRLLSSSSSPWRLLPWQPLPRRRPLSGSLHSSLFSILFSRTHSISLWQQTTLLQLSLGTNLLWI